MYTWIIAWMGVAICYAPIPLDLIISILIEMVSAMLSSTFTSLVERHTMSAVQRRVSPFITSSLFRLLQPLINRLKCLTKDITIPAKSIKVLFYVSPVYTCLVALILYVMLDLNIYSDKIDFQHMFILSIAILVCNSYGVLVNSYFSGSLIAMISAFKSVALPISYRSHITLISLSTVHYSNSLNMHKIIVSQQTGSYIFSLLPSLTMYVITMITKLKKIPFDVTEAESELGSGYVMEHSSSNFALIMVAKYLYVLILLLLSSMFSLSTVSLYIIAIKLTLLMILYSILRPILPNFRSDQIIELH